MDKIRRRVAITLLSTVFTLPVCSQVQNGEITGVATDSTEAAVVGARVNVRNLDTGFQLNLRTNHAGLFVASELPIGRYQLRVEATGFKVANSSRVTLNAGSSLRVDFHLTIGPRFESVEVTSSPAAVNIEDGRLSERVDSTQIANLPLNGRNVYDLIQYAPGATNVRGVIFENGANTVVNGVRENFNGFLINGVSNKGLSGGPVNQPIQDTVEEFQLLTLNNSAEFGNSAGAITNLVTKSGTNFFHGSLWEFLRNNIFDANPFFINHLPDPADRKQPPLRLNQFGGTLGGPIRKNKLFFFAAYQGDRFITSSPGPVLVESPQFRQAVESAFPDSVAALLYSSFPPNPNGQPGLTLRKYINNPPSGFVPHFPSFADYLCPDNTDLTGAMAAKFARLFGVEQADIDQMNQGGCPSGSPFSAPVAGAFNRDETFQMKTVTLGQSQVSDNLFDGNEASFRIDYDPSEKNRFFTQFSWRKSGNKFLSVQPALRANIATPSKLTTPIFQFSYIHLFSPTLLNEFRAGYTGNLSSATVQFPGVPNILFDDGTVGFGAYSGYPQIFHENIYTYSDLTSIGHGKHSLKIGADARRNLENTAFNTGRPSYFFFDPLFFALDAPYSQGAGVDPGFTSGRPAQLAPNARHFRNWEFGLFVQDNWRVFRRLTVNLGLRYDLYTRHTELDQLGTTFLKGPGHNFIDDITTGAGQIRDASTPCPGNPRAELAGACGPGGFAPAGTLGAGDHNDFGPRLGFAWDMFGDGKTALRGGAGVSYEGTLYNALTDSRWNPPYYSENGIGNFLVEGQEHIVYGPVAGGKPTFLGPAPPEQFAGSGLQATGNIVGWDPTNPNLSSSIPAIVLPEGIRDPYVVNWFLGIQRELRPSLVLEVNYVGTAGRKLFRAENVNRIPGGRLPEGTCVTDNFGRKLCSQVDENLNHRGRLNPNYGTLRVWQNTGNSIYHALQVSLRKKFSGGWQLGGNYTFSHSIDSGSGWHNSGTTANGSAAGDGFTTDVTIPGIDRGNSTFDFRHRLTFNYVWELPFFRQSHGSVAALLAGWQLNGIWSFQSGAHWTPFSPLPRRLTELVPGACQSVSFEPANCVNTVGDYNLDGENNDRPSAVADHIHASHDQWADGFNLPRNFFFAPCLGCVSNLGRNTFLGPGYWNVDTSIFKNFKIKDRFNLQFRVEAFNVFNHTNFQLAVNDVNCPCFGQAAGTAPPRNLQFGLKLLF